MPATTSRKNAEEWKQGRGCKRWRRSLSMSLSRLREARGRSATTMSLSLLEVLLSGSLSGGFIGNSSAEVECTPPECT